DPTTGGVIEAGDELGHGRLAGPSGADKGHGLAGLDGQVDVFEHRRPGVVREVDVLEPDAALNGRELHRIGALEDAGRRVEKIAQLEDRGPALLEGVVLLDQQLDGREEAVDVEEEGRQLAEIELMVLEHVAADTEDERLADD